MSKGIQFKNENNETIYPNPYFPVGSIYLSVNNVNPSKWFGGKWEKIAQGRTLVGVDTSQAEFNAVKKTGGSKTETLSINQMPAHNHNTSFRFSGGTGSDYAISWTNGTWQGPYDNAIGSVSVYHTGGSQPHNNLPPYFTCYIWCRVA